MNFWDVRAFWWSVWQQLFQGMRNKARAGFTLMELLVVVLIIGILSAVALPQYERAVARARTAEALSVLRSAVQAADAYTLEAGEWPPSYDVLSVVPGGELAKYKKDNDQVVGKYYKFTLIDGRVDAGPKQKEQYPGFLYVSDFAQGMKAPVPGSHFYCYYVADGSAADAKMEAMCKAMGGGEKKTVSGASTWFALD